MEPRARLSSRRTALEGKPASTPPATGITVTPAASSRCTTGQIPRAREHPDRRARSGRFEPSGYERVSAASNPGRRARRAVAYAARAGAADRRRARCRCPRARRRRGGAAAARPGAARGLVIHLDSPVAVAIRPSRVTPAFSRTNGRPIRQDSKKRSFRRRASSASTPSVTAIPARRSSAHAPPVHARVWDRASPPRTRRTPDARDERSARRRAFPRWAHGSRVT